MDVEFYNGCCAIKSWTHLHVSGDSHGALPQVPINFRAHKSTRHYLQQEKSLGTAFMDLFIIKSTLEKPRSHAMPEKDT